MLMQTLAVAVIKQARCDAEGIDGDYLLCLAHDPRLHWNTRHRLLRDHEEYIDALAFMSGSPDLYVWAYTAGLDAHTILDKWNQRGKQSQT